MLLTLLLCSESEAVPRISRWTEGRDSLGDAYSTVEMVAWGKCVKDSLALPQTELCVPVCAEMVTKLKSVLTHLHTFTYPCFNATVLPQEEHACAELQLRLLYHPLGWGNAARAKHMAGYT